MLFKEFYNKYGYFFESVSNKTALNPVSFAQLSFHVTKGDLKLLKRNNFFNIRKSNSQVVNKYLTPFEGIQQGLNLIVNNPKFKDLKVGTTKANPKIQFERLIQILN